jgi:hypothetical protein
MEFTDLMEDCTWITCNDFAGAWLLVAAICGLILAIGIARRVARRRAGVVLKLPRREGS